MSYKDWLENMTDEEKEAFGVKQKKYRNKAADKRQYEKYREILGKDVPRSLDKVQELKYNGGSEWDELTGFYRYKEEHPKASRNDYNCVKELHEMFSKGSFHIPAIEIDVSKLSFDSEHINKVRKHNVSEAEAKKFIKQAKASRTVWKGEFERYYSETGVAYVNLRLSEIRTDFHKEQFYGEAKKSWR